MCLYSVLLAWREPTCVKTRSFNKRQKLSFVDSFSLYIYETLMLAL
jgi:hypothetical protein